MRLAQIMFMQRYQFPDANTIDRQQTDFDYVMEQLQLDLKRLQQHTSQWSRYLSRSHLLFRLLNHLPIDLRLTNTEQDRLIFDFPLQKMTPLGLFTPVHKGVVMTDVIFGNRCPELLFASVDNDAKPIRCLRHPFESLNFWTNEPAAPESSEDIAVFSIDLLALVRSYRAFHSKHKEAAPTEYFYQVWLPSLLDDIAFITFINRFNSLLNRVPTFADEPRRTPFFIDYSDRLDGVIRTTIDQLLASDGHPSTLRAIMPLPWEESPRFPRIPLNSNTYALCFLCEAHFLTLLLTLTNTIKASYLNAFRQTALTELRSLQGGSLLTGTEPVLKTFLLDELQRIEALLKTHR